MRNPFTQPADQPVTIGAAPGGWAGLSGTTKLCVVGGVVAAGIGLVMWPSFSTSPPAAQSVPAADHQPSLISEYQEPPPVNDVVSQITGSPSNSTTNAGGAAVYRPLPTEMSLYSAPASLSAAAATTPSATQVSTDKSSAFGENAAVATNHATLVQHPDYVIRAGDEVPCLPIDAQNSSRPGFTTCRVPTWFRGTNQRRGLLPPGSRFFGQIKEGISAGQQRLGISYTLIQTPWFNMPVAAPAGDALGRSGVDVDVHTFFWEKAGAVALYAGMDAVTGIGQNVGTNLLSKGLGSNGTTLDINSGSQSLASQEFRSLTDKPPIGTRDQALPITVTMGQDQDFYEGCKQAMKIDPTACPLQSQ